MFFAGRDSAVGLGGAEEALPVLTPFEEWCDRAGVDPEALDAWLLFELAQLDPHPGTHPGTHPGAA